MTTKTDEQERAEFEAWWATEGQYCRAGGGNYEKTFAYRAYQAGRAALQSQAQTEPSEWLKQHEALMHRVSKAAMVVGYGGTINGATAEQSLEHAEKRLLDHARALQSQDHPNRQGRVMDKLFCDLKTDEEKAAFFLSGRGYETGVISQAIQNDVAMAYHRCVEYKKELEALQSQDREDVKEVIERLPRYNFGYVSDEWGMGRQLGAIRHDNGRFLRIDDVTVAIDHARRIEDRK